MLVNHTIFFNNSSRFFVQFSPEVINETMQTLSKEYNPENLHFWKDALWVLLTLTTSSLRFTTFKQFTANTLKLGMNKFLPILNETKIITSNWDFSLKQIRGTMYPITLSDSSYSDGTISKIEAYNMILLLNSNSEKAITKTGDEEDPWANNKRSNRKKQLSSTVEKIINLAVEISSSY